MHKPFHLIKRKLKKGTVWYCRFYDEYGERLPWRSTRQTSKAAAETWAIEKLKRGVVSKRS